MMRRTLIVDNPINRYSVGDRSKLVPRLAQNC